MVFVFEVEMFIVNTNKEILLWYCISIHHPIQITISFEIFLIFFFLILHQHRPIFLIFSKYFKNLMKLTPHVSLHIIYEM